MPKLRTSLVPSALTQALLDGAVRPWGVELDLAEPGPAATEPAIIERNSRLMVAGDLDVAQMSFGTFTRARDLGVPIIGLPIFPGRRFVQPAMAVAADSDLETPTDLRGKRAGIGQFWQTAFIWHRLVLHTRYSIRQEEINWTCTAPERWADLPSPRAPTRLDSSGRDPVALLRDGEVDVAMVGNGSTILGLTPSSGVRPLFEDGSGAQRAYFEQTGIFPIIHVIAMQEHLARDAGLVRALCEAFAESKRLGLAAMIESALSTPVLGGDPNAVPEVFGADPWPHGIGPNRKALEVFLGDVFEHQHLTDRRLQVEELFPASLPSELK